MAEDNTARDLLYLTSDIVAAHLSNNTVDSEQIPAVIEKVYRTLSNLNNGGAAAPDRPKPAVPVGKSVTPDFLICLEDGKQLKMLKRHLKTSYDMSPEEYRDRWGLPADYPMVAPNYAKKRSKLAKQIGLGKTGRKQA